MQRTDPFFIVIIFLFSTLLSAFFAFDFHLSGVELERQKVAALENKVKELEVTNESLKLQIADNTGLSKGSRRLASVSIKEILFDDLYKNQLKSAVAKRTVAEILLVTKKIISGSTDANLLAEAMYEKSVVSCQLAPNDEQCLSDIESLVTQFPESQWAGESLVILSQIYTKLKRFPEAESVLRIVKTNFSNDRAIIQKINKSEKKKL